MSLSNQRHLPLHQLSGSKRFKKDIPRRLAVHSAHQKCPRTSWTKLRSGRPSPERIPAHSDLCEGMRMQNMSFFQQRCGPRAQHQILAVQSWPAKSPFSSASICWRLHFREWIIAGQTSHSWFCYLIYQHVASSRLRPAIITSEVGRAGCLGGIQHQHPR